MTSDPSPTNLRRAWLAGYRVGDVEVTLARFSIRVSQLWSEVQELKAKLAAVEDDRRRLEQRLGDSRQREVDLSSAVSRSHVTGDALERDARAKAQMIVDAAELEAARIRGDASLSAETTRSQVDELLRLRDLLTATVRAVIRDFEIVVGRIDRGEGIGDRRTALAPAQEPSAGVPLVGDAASRPVSRAPSSLPRAGGEVFDRRVEVVAGPFNDFASLSAFERALGALPKVEDVYVRRFEGDRATIDLTMEEPGHLLDEMADRLPYRLDVERADADRITITLSAAG